MCSDIDPVLEKSKLTDFYHRYCLAYAEIYLTLAMMFRANGPKFELFETDESDVLHIHDYVHPMPKLSTKGIRVKVRQDYKHSIGKLSSQETQEFL